MSINTFGQVLTQSDEEKDYKDTKSHENYRKRRHAVASWQINQLKTGALVVRLNTNQLLINAYKQRGLADEAERARLEQAAANINIIRAYMSKYKFSKVYFIYSHSTDSLRQGTRTGIFLDDKLRIDRSITMKESFYLLAETDYVYNSSIGFVPEDSAAAVVEKGNPSSSEFPIVIKNKYGHQLKGPFPFSVSKVVFSKGVQVVNVDIDDKPVPFTVSSATRPGDSGSSSYKINGRNMELSIPRIYTYDVMSQMVEELDASFERFYRESPKQSEESKTYIDSKPFFY